MICPNCGQETSGKFCPQCGSPLDQKQTQEQAESIHAQETQEMPVDAAPTEPIAAENASVAVQVDQPVEAQGVYGDPVQAPYGQPEAQQSPYGRPEAQQSLYGQPEAQPEAQQAPYGQAQPMYGAASQGMSPQPEKQPWYGKTWVIVLFLLLFWPVGIVLMWLKSCKWAKGAKIGVTVALAVLLIGSITFSVMAFNQVMNAVQNTPARSSSVSTASSASKSSSSSSTSSKSSSASGSTKSGGSSGNSAITTECIDSSGNPSLYAISQLDGKALGDLLENYIGYSWNSAEGGWVYSKDNTVVAVINQSSTLGKSDIEKLAAAGGDTPVVYVMTAAGISTLQQALNAGNVVVEDTFTQADGSGAAVFYGPNMQEMMVIGTPDSDGTNYGNFSMLIFNRKAFESGLASEKLGAGSQGMTMEQLWETMTGKKLNN